MRNIYLTFLTLVSFVFVGFAQSNISMNADSLFYEAQKLSYEGKYDQSIDIAKEILEEYPNYKDVQVLMARTQAWSGNYKDAKKNIETLLSNKPDDYELNQLLLDVYIWTEDYESAHNTADDILKSYPNDTSTLEKKVRIYLAEKEPTLALEVLDKLEGTDSSDYLQLKGEAESLEKTLSDIAFNADSLFEVARELSYNGEYEQAKNISRSIIERFPDYTEVRVFLARTLAWSGNIDEAHDELNEIIAENGSDHELNNLMLDLYIWDEDYNTGINVADSLLNVYPYNITYLEKKAEMYLANRNWNKADKVLDTIEMFDPENEFLLAERESSITDGKNNIIRLEHHYDTFSKPYSRKWHMSSVGYGRKTSFGTFYGKVYWGDMIESGEKLFSDNVATQYALEFYPKLSRNSYMFLNYSYSDSDYFPKTRIGAEYYQNFNFGLGLSIGYRYLNFPMTVGDDLTVDIYTGSISQYFGKYWILFRPYIIKDGTGTSYRYMLSQRLFLAKDESYLELVLGTGVSPDNPFFYTSGQAIPDLNSWRIELEWKQLIGNSFIMELEGAYENAEYESSFKRDQYTIRSSISYLF